MDDAGAGASYGGGGNMDDTISFNGEDVRIGTLFSTGMVFKRSEEDNPMLSSLDDEPDMEQYAAEEDDQIVQANMNVIGFGRIPLNEILTQRPPKCKAIRNDPEFKNLIEDGRIRKKILQDGTGKTVASDSKVLFHYVAFANNSPDWFDNSLNRRPVSVRLEPAGEIIPGLRIALKTMQVLETAQIIIHHSLGYGDIGCPPRIPPKATLVYNIKMVTYVPVERLSYFQLNPEERSKVGFSKIVEFAKDERSKGQRHAHTNNNPAAIKCFRKGINLLEDFTTNNDQDNEQRCKLLAALYGSLAESYLASNKPSQCCVACKNGLNLQIKECTPHLLRMFASAKLKFSSYREAWDLFKRAKGMHGPEGGGPEKMRLEMLETQIQTKMATDDNADPDLYKVIFGEEPARGRGKKGPAQ